MIDSFDTRTSQLSGGEVILQPFTGDFISDEYIGWLNDPQLLRYSEQRHRRHDRASCAAFLAQFDQITAHFWAICLADGQHVGTATAFRDVPNATADMGILVGSPQGRGTGSAAWVAMRDWLFATGIRKVTAGTMSVNAPMLKIFERSGMAIEAVRRAQFLWENQEVDLVMAAIFRDAASDPDGVSA